MVKRTLAPVRVKQNPGPLSARDAIGAAFSAFGWALSLIAIVPHEASHLVAAWTLGYNSVGAGVAYEHVGTVRGMAVPRVRAFFVAHEPTDSKLHSWIIKLAPFGLTVFALPSVSAGSISLFGAVALLAAMTGVSDVIEAFVDDPVAPEATRLFVFGGPDQWQTRLGDYV